MNHNVAIRPTLVASVLALATMAADPEVDGSPSIALAPTQEHGRPGVRVRPFPFALTKRCAALLEQRAQHRSVAPDFVLAITADGEIGRV